MALVELLVKVQRRPEGGLRIKTDNFDGMVLGWRRPGILVPGAEVIDWIDNGTPLVTDLRGYLHPEEITKIARVMRRTRFFMTHTPAEIFAARQANIPPAMMDPDETNAEPEEKEALMQQYIDRANAHYAAYQAFGFDTSFSPNTLKRDAVIMANMTRRQITEIMSPKFRTTGHPMAPMIKRNRRKHRFPYWNILSAPTVSNLRDEGIRVEANRNVPTPAQFAQFNLSAS